MSPRQTIITFIICALVLMSGCARLPRNVERSPSYAYTTPEETALGKGAAEYLRAHPGESAYLTLGNGLDAFIARAELAREAERSIDAQYYMVRNDTVGGLFVDQLFKAADRGVRVRLLIDDIDMKGRDFGTAVIDNHPNIEVRIFNPFDRKIDRYLQFLTGFGKQTRRSHNKSYTIDNTATIVGGRNIGDEYFVADPELAFLDLDVLAIGPIAREVSDSFDQYWNHELSYPISVLAETKPTPEQARTAKEEFDRFIADQADSMYLKSLNESDLAENIKRRSLEYAWGPGHVLADHPDKLTSDTSDTSYHLSEELGPYLDSVAEELIILTPYFVPGDSGVAFFKELRNRGVRVRILTNGLSSTDVSIVHAGYANYRQALLKMGVELYELNRNLGKELRGTMKKGAFYESKSSLHAKSLVMDREKVFIGSLNLDPRSVIQNTEIGVIFESVNIASDLVKFFDEEVDKMAFRLELRTGYEGSEYIVWHGLVDGEQKTLYSEPHTSFWKRFVISFMRLLPVESQI